MKRLRVATAFTGGGVCLNRLDPARYEIAWGIEYDPRKAAVYSQNYPTSHMLVSRIQDVDFALLPAVDLWQVSPECKEFSAAKANGKEGPEQISQAAAICRGLRALRPKYFILENVRAYKSYLDPKNKKKRITTESWKMITATLTELGYMWDDKVLNSANFGVPQTRERLILRAVQGELLPHLPAPTRWVGWYEAIEDLIPSLPETTFANWQLERLPDHLGQSFIMRSQNTQQEGGNQTRPESWPAMTITANERPKAFLAASSNQALPRSEDAPAMVTVGTHPPKAFLMGKTKDKYGDGLAVEGESAMTIPATSQGQFKAWLSQGRVVKMTPRALARFMSMLDSYRLPDNNKLACEIIGNGFPSEMARIIFDNLTLAWFEAQGLAA